MSSKRAAEAVKSSDLHESSGLKKPLLLAAHVLLPPPRLKFYAPWCGYCKKLEPIWNEVGLELKTSGSPVHVGKMDATAYSGEYRRILGG